MEVVEAIDGPFQVDPDSSIWGIEGPDAALEVHPKDMGKEIQAEKTTYNCLSKMRGTHCIKKFTSRYSWSSGR